jgi:uncharacterized membrane protein (UPF0182 family)
MADAYTTSADFPYSAPAYATGGAAAPLYGANYYRNSVKATVDAYDGTAHFYVVDEQDPIIRAWEAVYPGLLTAADEMPDELKDHWRYPEALFRAQTATYARYHMTNPDTFYLAEDLWQIPLETTQDGNWEPLEPYYVTIALRGEESPEFVMMLPFAPANKKNMVAWMAARSDAEHYGELIVYSFDKGRFVVGPEQVEGRIDQDPAVSKELTLLGQEGSVVIRGNLLVIPVEDALVFVEPLYIEAERTESALPELKRVIVVSGDRVVMRPTLTGALAAAVNLVPETAAEGGADTQIPVDELVRRLREQWDRASGARREGLRAGDGGVRAVAAVAGARRGRGAGGCDAGRRGGRDRDPLGRQWGGCGVRPAALVCADAAPGPASSRRRRRCGVGLSGRGLPAGSTKLRLRPRCRIGPRPRLLRGSSALTARPPTPYSPAAAGTQKGLEGLAGS